MRIVFTILSLILIYSFVNRPLTNNHYYVDNSGSDGNDGLTPATAWQTISKVNGFLFAANDTISFKCGGSWNEKLLPPSSNLIFNSYSIGNKPIITGLQSAGAFTNDSANYWSATISNSVKNQNTILINGVMTAKGRYPNTDSILFYPYSQTKLRDYYFHLTTDWTGAEAVIREYGWIRDVCKVTSQLNDTIFVSPTTYNTNALNGVFFQNSIKALDLQNEWYYDSASKKLGIYSSGAPTNVQFSSIDTLVYGMKKDYLTFDGIRFTGANIAALRLDTSNHTTIKNCSFSNIGRDAIRIIYGHHTILQNDSITNVWSDGAYIVIADSSNVTGNYFNNIGVKAGMGTSGNSTYIALNLNGDSSQITYNTSKNTGYSSIYWSGKKSYVYKNFVDSFCFIKDDGGGIYTAGNISTGAIVRKNITLHGIGANYKDAPGIYCDNNAAGITIDSNSVSSCLVGMLFHTNNLVAVKYNTVHQLKGIGISNDGTSYLTTIGNIAFSGDSTTNVFTANNLATSDSNYFSRPIKQLLAFNYANVNYDFPNFHSTSGLDAHSYMVYPSNVTSIIPTFYYNNTLSDSTITFSGIKKDLRGNKYSGSVTLHSFSSIILFPSISVNHSKLGSLNL